VSEGQTIADLRLLIADCRLPIVYDLATYNYLNLQAKNRTISNQQSAIGNQQSAIGNFLKSGGSPLVCHAS